MKIAIILCARSGSKRLPQKHLISLGSTTPLEILCNRINNLSNLSDPFNVCIATTSESSDDIFEEKKPNGTIVFRGNTNNIPYRQMEAAISLNSDLVVSVDGDDIFSSPEAIYKLVETYKSATDRDKKIFNSFGMPFGMNVSCYSTILLKERLFELKDQTLETGWGRVFSQYEKVEVDCSLQIEYPEKETRFTLDYAEDLELLKKLYQHFQKDIFSVPSKEILRFVVMNHLYEINSSVVEKYWENFYQEKKREEANSSSKG